MALVDAMTMVNMMHMEDPMPMMDPLPMMEPLPVLDLMPMVYRHHACLFALPVSPPNMYFCLRRRFIEPVSLV